MNLTAFPSREALIEAAAARLARALHSAIAKRGAAYAALSGGSTPAPIYRALAAAPLAWPKITFALVDERFVPPSSPASNQGMIEGALAPALAAGARLLPMYAAAQTLEAAADCADALYAPLSYDIALMGMGEDGHTASWFPGIFGLGALLDPRTPRAVLAVEAAHATGSTERLTLTRAALMRSEELLMVITGEAKRARLGRALMLQNAPVAALFSDGMPPIEVLWAA